MARPECLSPRVGRRALCGARAAETLRPGLPSVANWSRPADWIRAAVTKRVADLWDRARYALKSIMSAAPSRREIRREPRPAGIRGEVGCSSARRTHHIRGIRG